MINPEQQHWCYKQQGFIYSSLLILQNDPVEASKQLYR